MSNVINFIKYKNNRKIEEYVLDLEANDIDEIYCNTPVKTWDDYTREEKIECIFKNNLFLNEYIEFASMQRYRKRSEPSVYIENYQEWIYRRLDEDERKRNKNANSSRMQNHAHKSRMPHRGTPKHH
jgi:hypothetical protein